MKLLKRNIILFILATAVTACTRVIDLNLDSDTGRMVIEANITNVKGIQTIRLTQNVPLSSINTYPGISGATVLVTDNGGNQYNFTQTLPGTYIAANVAGIASNVYTLSVACNGKTYTAQSTMPATVALDSVTSKNTVLNASKGRKQITVHFQDPKGLGNQYRFILYVNGIQIKREFVFNDDFIDGNYAHIDLRQSDTDIFTGDKVTVEMQCIDKPVYTYWYSIQQQLPSGPGGGVTPTDPPTNITPSNTLGYFSAHTTQSVGIVVK
jgi:hypothetical protein